MKYNFPTLQEFCETLDKKIGEYHGEKSEELYEILAYLQYILDENVDAGVKPRTALKNIQGYLKNDLESFLYHVIYDEIEVQDISYSGELLEGFDRYVEERSWFEYLNVRHAILADPEVGFEKLEKFTQKKKKEEMNLDLFLEMLSFLATSGNHTQFVELALVILPEVKLERDFLEFSDIVASHYRHLTLPSLSTAVSEIVGRRASLFQPGQDPALLEIKKILEQKLSL